jgi:hypothetical protein
MSDSSDEVEKYLYVVEYEEDAERKRAEYLFNNWGSGEINRPDGLVRIGKGVDNDELYEQLITKVPAEQISVYQLDTVDADVEPEKALIKKEVDASVDAVETFLEYILSKKKAVLQSATRNEYEVYTKKGRAELSYEIREGDDSVVVHVRIEGYPPAPSFLADFFETELTDYAASQTSDQS